MLKGFRDFIMRGNVVDLAVAVVVGSAFSAVVNSFVKGLFTPLIGVIGGTPDFSGLTFTVNKSQFLIGDLLNALISFLLVSAVIYFLVVLPMNTIKTRLSKEEKSGPNDKTCPECLSKIPVKAKRCKFCTAVLKK